MGREYNIYIFIVITTECFLKLQTNQTDFSSGTCPHQKLPRCNASSVRTISRVSHKPSDTPRVLDPYGRAHCPDRWGYIAVPPPVRRPDAFLRIDREDLWRHKGAQPEGSQPEGFCFFRVRVASIQKEIEKPSHIVVFSRFRQEQECS